MTFFLPIAIRPSFFLRKSPNITQEPLKNEDLIFIIYFIALRVFKYFSVTFSLFFYKRKGSLKNTLVLRKIRWQENNVALFILIVVINVQNINLYFVLFFLLKYCIVCQGENGIGSEENLAVSLFNA